MKYCERLVEVCRMNYIIKSIDQLPRTIDGTIFGELTNNAVNKRLKKYCNNLGIKEITSHALRHTHCSYLLAKGISKSDLGGTPRRN